MTILPAPCDNFLAWKQGSGSITAWVMPYALNGQDEKLKCVHARVCKIRRQHGGHEVTGDNIFMAILVEVANYHRTGGASCIQGILALYTP